MDQPICGGVLAPEGLDVPRRDVADAIAAEGRFQCAAVVVAVVRNDFLVGGQQRGGEVVEREVDRRQVVDGSDAHGQDVGRGLDALVGDTRAVERGALGVDVDQALGPDLQHGIADGCDQDFSPSVGLLERRLRQKIRVRRKSD